MRNPGGLLLVALFLGGCGASEKSGLPSFPEPFPAAVSGPIRVPQDFPTLKAAVDAASSGDTILVSRGFYEGQVRITKKLTIQGDGGATLTNALNNTTVFLGDGSTGTSLSGFLIEGTGRVVQAVGDQTPVTSIRLENLEVRATGPEGTAIACDNSPGLVVSNCTLQATFAGLQMGRGTASPDMRAQNIRVRMAPRLDNAGAQFINCPRVVVTDLSVESQDPAQPFGRLAEAVGLRGTNLRTGDTSAQYVPVPDARFERVTVNAPGSAFAFSVVNAPGLLVRDCSFIGGILQPSDQPAGVVTLDSTTDFTMPNILLERVQVKTTSELTPSCLLVEGFTSNCTVTNCSVAGGQVGLYFRDATNFSSPGNSTNLGLHTSPRVQNCTVSGQSGFALGMSFTRQGVVERCRLTDAFASLAMGKSQGLSVRNNLLLNGDTAVVGVFDDPTDAALTNNVLAGFFTLFDLVPSVQVGVRNNIFYAYEALLAKGRVTGDFNDFFLGPVPPGAPEVDPLFTDLKDFRLSPGSPLIDQGDPAQAFNDRIPPGLGTVRNDLGAYGGPSAGNVGTLP